MKKTILTLATVALLTSVANAAWTFNSSPSKIIHPSGWELRVTVSGTELTLVSSAVIATPVKPASLPLAEPITGYTLTRIAANAFKDNSSITGLTLPSTLTAIGEGAFQSCLNLKGTLTIPGRVTTISKNAFYGCSSLTGLTLQNGIQHIGESAFEDCTALKGT